MGEPFPLVTNRPYETHRVEGKKLVFAAEAHDGIDLIAKGRHERFVINKEKFDARLSAKLQKE